jgi:hypothetical protein
MTDRELKLREEDFFDMLSFLVSSAYLMAQGEEFEEFYPSFRLMDAACRLTSLFRDEFEDESWVRQFSDGCGEGLDLMGRDDDAFVDFLAHSTLMLAREMKNRNE